VSDFTSIADLKVVVGLENEGLTKGLASTSELIKGWATEGAGFIGGFDQAMKGLGVGSEVFATLSSGVSTLGGRLGTLQTVLQATRQVFAALGAEEGLAQVDTAFADLQSAFSTTFTASLEQASSEVTLLAQNLLGLGGDLGDTQTSITSLADAALNLAATGIKEVSFQIRSLGPESAQGLDVLTESLRRAEVQVAKLRAAADAGGSDLTLMGPYGSLADRIDKSAEALKREADQLENRMGLTRMMIGLEEYYAAAKKRDADEASNQADLDAGEKSLAQIERQVAALERKAGTLGMTAAAAAALSAHEEGLAALQKDGLSENPNVVAALDGLIERYKAAQVSIDAYSAAEKRRLEAQRQDQQAERTVSAMENEIVAIERRTTALTQSAAASAADNATARALTGIKQSGREATDAERESIRGHAVAIGESTAAFETMRSNLALLKDTTNVVGRSMEKAFSDWTRGAVIDSRQMARSILADLAMIAFRKGVIEPAGNAVIQGVGGLLGSGGSEGGGGFIGALGSLFGGFRAEGGPVKGGVPYVVGERGPELFVPNASGTILPNGTTLSSGGIPAGGGGISASITVVINAQGAYPESIAEIRAAVVGLEQTLPGRVVAHVAEARQRGILE